MKTPIVMTIRGKYMNGKIIATIKTITPKIQPQLLFPIFHSLY